MVSALTSQSPTVKKNKPLRISILTLFPEMFQSPFEYSIIKKAQEKNLVEIKTINIRDFGIGKHKIVDDTPYGGGIGMVIRADILSEAIKYAKANKFSVIPSEVEAPPRSGKYSWSESHTTKASKTGLWHEIPPRAEPALSLPNVLGQDDKLKKKVILLSASGKIYNQQKAKEYATLDHLILICGHYEGVDERVKKYINEEISVGDYICTGGEIPAMLIADSVIRLIHGVLKPGATENESFSLTGEKDEIYLEYPQYTKPHTFEGIPVPKILLSGDHKKIHEWRMKQAQEKTQRVRPDLLKSKNKK